ncbi:hypothetical protein PAXINDRAFT_102093 [Paxillus involutus ATCC 200175]|uniref:Unplaced genomic scaffold PAXINscaffold_95, whole genome shotgun sequence n=1 Tax=Paxillus involutus ATCC 200175 TaxID=664439 RepID=A0A0C9TQV3_PAXIN|nr:hypothetical protein PAXINDRAFT_102093 [Paxillus involutus ATCC 200175]
MSAFQVPTTYDQRRYFESPSNTSSNGHAIPSCDAALVDHGFTQANDYGQYPSLNGVEGYSHQGYEDGHLIQEQVYRPPPSEYYQHCQPDGPPMLANSYTIRQGSGTADPTSPTSIGTSESFNTTSDVSGIPTTPAALARGYPYVPHQILAPNTSSSLASSTVATHDKSHVNQVWLPSLGYDHGRDEFSSGGGVVFRSSNVVPCPASPLLGPLAEQHAASFGHRFSEKHTSNWNLADTQSTVHAATSPSFPLNPFSHPSPYHDPQPSPSVHIGLDGRTHSGVYYLPQNDSANPSRRRNRPARAIEHDGLLMDEEELLEGLMAPGAKITVHECRWEENSSPCHLWVKSDKSYINTHIQKWHGGAPGGDKVKTHCRWSTCQKKMLKESVCRHVVNIHLEEKWECQGCGGEIARKDAYGRHAERAKNAACRNAGALIMYYAGARVIDARAALASRSGGRHADV